MAIHFTCPACKKSVRASDETAGLNGPCPSCKARIPIPRIATVVGQEKGSDNGHGNGNGNGKDEVPEVVAKTASGKDLKPAQPLSNGKTAFPPPPELSDAPPPAPPIPIPPPAPTARYIKFKCPNCEKPIGFPAAQAGSPAVCPKCLTRVMVPEKDGEESFIVGALAAAHKNIPNVRLTVTPAVRLHPIRRTAHRLRVAVKTMPWWQTALISVCCTAALVLAGVIIVSEFNKEWNAREQARQQAFFQDGPAERPAPAPTNTGNSLAGPERPSPVPVKEPPVVETRTPIAQPQTGPVPASQPVLIGAREEAPTEKQVFDPKKLFSLEGRTPSARATEGEEPVAEEPPPVSSSPLPPAQPKVEEEPADPVLNLLDKAEKKEVPATPPAPAPAEKDGAPEIVGPAAFKPPDDAALVQPPTVCGDCQGTTVLPLASYQPYLWDYKQPAPAALAALPHVPCAKCQGQVDAKTLVTRETERMRTAPARMREWPKKLNARMECGETRYISVASQLSPASSRHVLQQLDKLTQFLQRNFRSALLTQTRPDTHELLIAWDRTSYERLIDLMAAENPTHDWDLTRRASGSIARELCFFNAHRGLSTPPEHMALFQFAHMLILEATDAKTPVWLTEGFASYCENTILKKNLCYAFRYELNQVRLGVNWNSEIARYARAGKLKPWERVFKLDLIGMNALDYLTCYSMVRFLSSDPGRFNTLLVNIRAGMDSKRAVEHAYGRKVDDLQKMWAQWALQQR